VRTAGLEPAQEFPPEGFNYELDESLDSSGSRPAFHFGTRPSQFKPMINDLGWGANVMAENITRADALERASNNEMGTGIYWFVDNARRFEQIFVPSITYQRSRELAEDFNLGGRQTLDAYRWVPDKVEDVVSLVSRQCSGSCTRDLDCVDNACRCINGQCRRK
jgi:hypothetical protein